MFEGRCIKFSVDRRFWVTGVHERLRDGRRRGDVGAAAHGQAARLGVSVLRAEETDPLARGKGTDVLAFDEFDDEPVLDVTLRPGDVLYVPAGWPHTTDTLDCATDDPSIHLTLGVDTHVWGLDAVTIVDAAGADHQYRGFTNEHAGFRGALDSIAMRLKQLVLRACDDRPEDWELLVTGHSLGGALATLCAYDLLTSSPIVAERGCSVLSLAGPRFFDHSLIHLRVN